jgi:hypothetical protein
MKSKGTAVERRSLSFMALVGSGAVVFLALVALLLEVRADAPEPELSQEELARAAAAGRTRRSAAAPSAPAPPSIPPPRTARAPSPPADGREPPQLPATGRPIGPPSGETAGDTSGGQAWVGATAGDQLPTPEQASVMREAIEYYDRGDYENARSAAVEALRMKINRMGVDRMQRIAASASCFLEDAAQARIWYQQLSPASKPDIEKRCEKMGIDL